MFNFYKDMGVFRGNSKEDYLSKSGKLSLARAEQSRANPLQHVSEGALPAEAAAKAGVETGWRIP